VTLPLPKVLQANSQPVLVLVGGPSGSGKTSIINSLLSRYPGVYERPLSYTTRPPRPGDTSGEFHHTTESHILELLGANEIPTIDRVYGNAYAMSSRSIDIIIESHRIPIKEVHPSNHAKLRRTFPSLLSVHITWIPGDRESTVERSDRAAADGSYYASFSLAETDIVIWNDHKDSIDALADRLHHSLTSTLCEADRFALPSEIDRLNTAGYTGIAAEFSEAKRITTRNFHEMSTPFFEKSLQNRIADGACCAEIGPGRGWLRNSFTWPHVHYTAIDVSESMLKAQPADSTILASARAIPVRNASFDAVFGSLIDPYCYPAALCEIRRVLKTGGLFILSSPAAEWAYGLRDGDGLDKTRFVHDDGTIAEVFSYVFTLEELSLLLERCGFSVLASDRLLGNALMLGREISPAITDSASRLGVAVSDLPIVNLAVVQRME
jgi:guanylate kinase/SAM-dependent methyltransferase